VLHSTGDGETEDGGRRAKRPVEYLLTTLTLVTIFAGMYGFLHGALRKLFISAGVRILTSYY